MRRLERALQAGIVLALALLAFGWALAPEAAPLPPAAVVIGCGLFWHFAVSALARAHRRAAPIAILAGGLSALVFVPSILIEYVGRTVDNNVMLAVMFALWLMCGALVAAVSGRLRDAVLGATVSAQIASLASVVTMLASYYVLRGSALQDRFFRTEGTYDDFARSGFHDLGTFVIDDMFGGTFFHLVLGTFAGVLMGTIGGAIVMGLRQFSRRRRGGLPDCGQDLGS